MNNLAKDNPQHFWAELKKLKRKNSAGKGNGSVSKEDFCNHFKYMYGDSNVFTNNDVENEMCNDNNVVNVEQLDKDFTIEEIIKAISTLKRGKSGGVDLITSEMLIECQDVLSPLLCKLFNHMLLHCLYPVSWTKGIIVPIPKKGNQNDVNNYRGITLSSVLSKIFSVLLDIRLRDWAEVNNLLSIFQFGFRKNKSTIDCVFVLTSIINKIVNNDKKKLYCAFIDFRKAFDMVYRNGIWFKLLQLGASTKIVKILQKIYENVKSCVRVNGECSEYFDSYMGVKQGEPLSPLLFIFFINDMYASLSDNSIESFCIEEINVFLLLFADDTVLFSYSKEGLQCLLNKLHSYCNKWGVFVNIDKTVVMVCKKGNRVENVELFYDNHVLRNVTKFTYLGITLSSNGCFYQAQKSLAEQASKALFSLNSLFDIVSLDLSVKLRLFDSMIAPILNYGCEVWGFHKGPNIERIYLKFLKQILRVKPQTMDCIIFGELGRVPMYVIRKIRILKFWAKIVNSPQSLLYKVLYLNDDRGKLTNTFAINVQNLLNGLGYGYIFENNFISNSDLQNVVRRIYDQYFQQWSINVSSSTKTDFYCMFKSDNNLQVEKYLTIVKNIKHRIELTRFRCSSHRLMIEEGRYRNVARNERLCTKCNMHAIENEYHFLLVCPFYKHIRELCLPRYYCHWPNLVKLKNLMCCKQNSIVSRLAKYLYMATMHRG